MALINRILRTMRHRGIDGPVIVAVAAGVLAGSTAAPVVAVALTDAAMKFFNSTNTAAGCAARPAVNKDNA